MLRSGVAVVAVVAALLISAGPAWAGTVSESAATVHYVAAPGEFNELWVAGQGGQFTIQDGTSGTRTTLPVTALPPCQPYSGDAIILIDAVCPASGVTEIDIDVGDSNDSVTIGMGGGTDVPARVDAGDGNDRVWGGSQSDDIRGGAGDDSLTGNGGRDMLAGGSGDDVIAAADGLPDTITCGAGYDAVTADAIDVVGGECELINGAPNPTPSSEPPEDNEEKLAASSWPPAVLTVVASQTVADVRASGLRASLTCARTCSARSKLLLSRTTAAARRTPDRLVGQGTARRSSGGVVTLVTHLRAGAYVRLRRMHVTRLVLRTTVTIDGWTRTFDRLVRLQ